MIAAKYGHIATLQWLAKNGASITERNNTGCTSLLAAAYGLDQLLRNIKMTIQCYGQITTQNFGTIKGFCEMMQWCLEHGGSDITETDKAGKTIWGLLHRLLLRAKRWNPEEKLLRVMLLRGGPPAEMKGRFLPEGEATHLVEEGERLRALLPAYLMQRRALLDTHCPLIAPLRDIIHDYEVPTTAEELWATGVGVVTVYKTTAA
jgi:hypothetical protein